MSTTYGDPADMHNMILESIQEAVIVTDLHGIILYWNKGASQLYGWTQDEVLGENIVSITPSRQTEDQAIRILERLSEGHSWTGQFLLKKKDGTEFLALVTDRPMYKDGILIGVVGTSVDMYSEQVRHQIATSAVAHELRAPVTGIIGMLKSMLGEKPLRICVDDLELLYLASNTLLNFVNNLIESPLEEVEKSSPAIQKCNLRKEIQSVISIMNPLGREDSITVSLIVSKRLPTHVSLVVVKFQQALFNVLNNAFKYTRPSSQIICRVYNEIDFSMNHTNNNTMNQNSIPFVLVPGIKYLFVTIRDQGKGISSDEATLLFKSYSMLDNKTFDSRVSPSSGSSGLGLFNCKTFLNRLGGDIWVSWSEENVGTEFTFTLPYIAVEEVVSNEESRRASSVTVINGQNSHENYEDVFNFKSNYQRQQSTRETIQLSPSYFTPSLESPNRRLSSIRSKLPRSTSFSDYGDSISCTDTPLFSSPIHGNLLSPLVVDAESRSSTSTSSSPMIKPLGLNVLVCDDDAVSRRIMTRLLNAERAAVLTAMNGRQALDTVLARINSGNPFHILFLDLNMPILDGYQCAAKIRELVAMNISSAPIICALTAHLVSEVYDKCMEYGFNEVITKPMTTEKIRQLLEEYFPKTI